MTTTMAATMSAIQERLDQLNVMLSRIAVDLKKTTAALTPTTTTTPTFVPDRVPEQSTFKPSSTSPFPAVPVVALGVLHADATIASAPPIRCSTEGPAHYTDSGSAEIVFPASDRTHLPVTTSSLVGNNRLQGVGGTGTNSPASCSTLGSAVNIRCNHAVVAFPTSGVTRRPAMMSIDASSNALQALGEASVSTRTGCLTQVVSWPQDGLGACALGIDHDMSAEVLTQIGGLSLFQECCADAYDAMGKIDRKSVV